MSSSTSRTRRSTRSSWRSLRAALLAQGLAEQANLANPEEAHLIGLFSNLGRLWLAAHYRDELARAVELQAAEADSIDEAIKRHFGFSSDVLAAQILEQWGLPSKYSNFFRRHVEQRARSAIEDKLILVAELSTEDDDSEFVERAQDDLNLSEEKVRGVLEATLEALNEQAEALGIGSSPPKRSAKKAAAPKPAAVPAPASAPGVEESAPGVVADLAPPVDRRRADSAFGMQAAAGIARSIVDREDLGVLLGDVLEGVSRAGGFDAVVLYLVDGNKENLAARLSYGPGVARHLGELGVPLSKDGGVVAATLLDQTARAIEVASPALLVVAGTEPPDIPARSVVTHPLSVRELSSAAATPRRSSLRGV